MQMPPSWHNRKVPREPLQAEVEAQLGGRCLDKSWLYECEILLYGDWMNGSKPKRMDALNFGKVAEDVTFRALKLDDSYNFRFISEKVEGEWGVTVTVSALRPI